MGDQQRGGAWEERRAGAVRGGGGLITAKFSVEAGCTPHGEDKRDYALYQKVGGQQLGRDCDHGKKQTAQAYRSNRRSDRVFAAEEPHLSPPPSNYHSDPEQQMSAQMTVDGLDALRRQLASMSDKLRKRGEAKALREAGRVLQEEIQKNVAGLDLALENAQKIPLPEDLASPRTTGALSEDSQAGSAD